MTRPAVYRLLLLPLAAWTAHVAAGFLVVALHCHRGYFGGTLLSLTGAHAAQLVLTVAGAALLIVALAAGLRLWRSAQSPERDPTGGHGIVFAISALTSALALLYLAWSVVLTSAGGVCS